MHKIFYKSFALIIFALLVSIPGTQTTAMLAPASATNEDRIALYQALLDLSNPWTVMCIAAHPDDEDGTSLTVMRHKYGVHTVSLFSTFGEGGQNAIGPELYEEMGVIRARETMAAAEIQGSEPHFLGLKDFGFSKSADEAFKFWGHDEALRRMVLKIRELRPDVIITNHDTSGGHGHHQATGRLELEAFDAAADPKRFPEQLKDGVTIWQVQRLFVRGGFGGGSANAGQRPAEGAPSNLVTIDPNEQDPVRGTTYAEQALAALQKHATQGPWPKTVADLSRFRNSPDGRLPMIRYRLVREAKGAAALPSDSHYPLEGLRLPEDIAKLLAPPTVDGRSLVEVIDQRKELLDALVKIRKTGRFRPVKSDDTPRFQRIDQRLDGAFAAVTRISAKTTARDEVVIPGLPTAFKVTISNNGDLPTSVYSYTFFAGKRNVKTLYTGSVPFPPGDTGSVTDDWTIPRETIPSLPHAQHLYDGRVFGDDFKEVVTINLADIQFSVTGSTRVDVGPAVEIADISPSPLVIRPAKVGVSSAGADMFPPPDPKFTVRLINHLDKPFKGELVFGEENRKGETNRGVELLPHQSTTLSFSLPSPEAKTNAAHSQPGTAAASVWFSVRRAGSRENITTSRVPIVWANAYVPWRLRVGYVRGFDFSLPNALSALGVESKELSVEEVKTADLQKYSTIIIDNRVYESQPELIAANQRLLDYAKDGGTLVVFYHKSNEWNPDQRRNRPQLAPYPLTLGDARITDEEAPVTFTEADHPLLNVPNKLSQEDFAGWIQERGLYYPREWDTHYHALLSANDPGEKPLTGGLLVTDYGKGHYIYSSMVWYRQLRAGVPGGYRMFANMISYGHQ